MLEVLLADRVPESWLSAPRRRLRGVADLAEVARVSPASASGFLAALEAEVHLADRAQGLRLARVESLLHGWRRSLQRPVERRHVRFLLPSDDPYRDLRRVLAGRAARRDSSDAAAGAAGAGPKGARACLGLFAACRALGVGFVQDPPVQLLSEDLSPAFLEELELVPVDHRAESELIVIRPRFPEAVFRGCVLVEGAPVADILQCWLDVTFHPARGEEQADEIAARLGLERWDQ